MQVDSGPSRGQLLSVLNAQPTPVAYLDSQQRYRFANDAYRNWHHSVDWSAPLHVRSILGDAYSSVRPYIDEVLSGRAVGFSISLPLEEPDDIGTFDVRYIPIKEVGGHDGGFVAFLIDISKQKHLEQSLEQSEGARNELVSRAVHGIFRSCINGRILEANSALAKMLGYDKPEELMQLDIARDIYFEPCQRAQLIAQQGDDELIVPSEVVWKRKDGAKVHALLSGRALFDAAGNIECFDMIAQDVTRQRELETQLRQAQKMEAIGQLTGGIAHDFNNLLTVVLSNTEFMRETLSKDPDVQASLNDVITAAGRGTSLIRKLMSFSRQEQLEFQTLKLGSVLSGVQSFLLRLLPETIDVEVVLNQSFPPTRADPRAVEQILLNLVTNARDAMPEGGKLKIEMTHQSRERDYICIQVTDSGEGMSTETMARVFEPFYTTKPVGSGTGLGLSMVRGLMEQHDGHVEVRSRLGEGTTVTLLFPPDRRGTIERTEIEPRAVATTGNERILVVEDDQAIRKMMDRVLSRHGYRVEHAANGAEALKVLDQSHAEIDLVVSDLVMPVIGGAQLIREVRHRDLTRIPFLLMSGHMPEDHQIGDLDSVARLRKPWSLEELLISVREVLDNQYH